MSAAFGKFRSSLMAALSKIGKTNGHAAPVGGSNTDALMHEYLVSTDAEAFFSRRRDEAKTLMLEAVDQKELTDVVKRVKANKVAEETMLLKGKHYMLSVKIARPATRLDATKLRNELKKLPGVDAAKIDALFADCIAENEPAKSFRVVSTQ